MLLVIISRLSHTIKVWNLSCIQFFLNILECLTTNKAQACLTITEGCVLCKFAATEVHALPLYLFINRKLDPLDKRSSVTEVTEGLGLGHTTRTPVVVFCSIKDIVYLVWS